jgi:hypothetical protein
MQIDDAQLNRMTGNIERLQRIMRKIAEHAKDGLSGSPDYALDRLKQIQKLTEIGLLGAPRG